jgi:hypothetical protein
MAYFNHAFNKVFLGTGETRTAISTGAPITATNPASTEGFITTAGVTSETLSRLSPGYFGFFDPKTFKTVNSPSCCPLILACSSLMAKDKIGPFLGGYRETNKSKTINPKYINKTYVVDQCTPQQSVVSIGNTVYTDDVVVSLTINNAGVGYPVDGTFTGVPLAGGTGTGATANIVIAGGIVVLVTINNGGTGYTTGDNLVPDATVMGGAPGTPAEFDAVVSISAGCCHEFYCGETYYLRVDVKGSPALRALNHNAYQTLDAYTGCCAGPTPTLVDSTLVMIAWANEMVTNNYLNSFILPFVYDEAGVVWYAPGTTTDITSGLAVNPSEWWDAYVSPGHTASACAGLRVFGAYVETQFGNCSFQVTDFFEKEAVQIFASMVDYTGDPCTFEGICLVRECNGVQGIGFGEQVVRDLILSQSYLQNFFHTDIRIREITQGTDILNSVNRNALYTRYYILHSVPRFNNPSSTFDNDQYMLEIVTNRRNAALETYINDWTDNCGACEEMEVMTCTPCVVLENPSR